MIARHMHQVNRDKKMRMLVKLRILISTVFAVGALSLGVYLGLTIGGVVELDWIIFCAVLLGLVVGNSFAWGYLDEVERRC